MKAELANRPGVRNRRHLPISSVEWSHMDAILNSIAHIHPGLVVAGLLVGVLVGLTGMGGGSLMTPMLMFFFGFNAVTAVGTDILHGAIFKTAGAWKHLRLGSVHIKLATMLALGAVPASIAGVQVIKQIEKIWGRDVLESLMKETLGGMLLVIAVILLTRLFMQARKSKKTGKVIALEAHAPMEMTRERSLMALAIGVGAGFIVGLTSVGSGTIVGLLLMILFPLSARRIVGTDILNAAVLLWAAGLSHLVAGNVDMVAMASLLIGSIPGVIVGSHLTLRFNDLPLRLTIGVIIALSGAKLVGAPDMVIAFGLGAALTWILSVVIRSYRRPLPSLMPTVGRLGTDGKAA